MSYAQTTDYRLGVPGRDNALLQEKLLHRMPTPGDYPTAIENLTLHRRDEINKSENCFYGPIAAITIQGAKRTVIGTEEYRYGEGNCLVSGVDMPSVNQILVASPERPYLVVSLGLDNQLTTELATQLHIRPGKGPFKGTAVAPTAPEVLQAFLRLVELLDKPEQIPVLASMIVREIHFRLLAGPQGELLRTINTLGTQSNQVLRAINWLRQNFKEPLDVEALARNAYMAPPTFRKHFKSITTMSATRYHQHLRLYEAQRLMLLEKMDATNAGHAVGYESPVQFNREYKRLFGDPPQRNVSQLR